MIPLRERKKIKTRMEIQKQALHLFKVQGYAQTTVEQIAQAAEVSSSTFFRYFATKEEVVLQDDFDPIFIEVFLKQPPEIAPLRALQNAIRTLLSNIPEEMLEQEIERQRLLMEVPEIRARMLDNLAQSGKVLIAALAQRLDKPESHPQVQALSAAILGMIILLLPTLHTEPQTSFFLIIEKALMTLEDGLLI